MGISDKTTKSTNQSTTVNTPTNPDWIEAPYKDYFGQVANLGKTGNPADFVAPASKLQTTAWDKALNLSSDPGGNYAAAGAAARAGAAPIGAAGYNPATYSATGYDASSAGPMAHVAGQSLLDHLQDYVNPATQALVDTSLSDFDRSAGQQRAADDLRGAQNGALGGSGFALQKSLTEGELSRARASTDANLRYNAFDRATSLSGQDADRRQQAQVFNAGADNTGALTDAAARNDAARFGAGATNDAGAFNAGANNEAWKFNAGQAQSAAEGNATRQLQSSGILTTLGNSMGTNDRDTLTLLSQLGGDQRNVDQAQRLAPLSYLQSIGSLYGLGDPNLFKGSTANTTGNNTTIENDPMGQLSKLIAAGGAALQGAAAFSDGRLKRSVETAGYDAKGRRWVDFNYAWDGPDEPRRRGVIAQEVLATDPGAVALHRSGYLTVDYSQLEAA